ncbi:MAG: HAMP domain-containing protein [Burkholderiales bacterium]|nr:HAMP domain-containing protein [Anaerolineae bacterium]
MIHSLRLRLLLMMVIVLSVAIGAVALFASQTTTTEFERWIAYDDTTKAERFNMLLTNFYTEADSWEGVEPLIQQIGAVTGDRILLMDDKGQLVASAGIAFSPEQMSPFASFRDTVPAPDQAAHAAPFAETVPALESSPSDGLMALLGINFSSDEAVVADGEMSVPAPVQIGHSASGDVMWQSSDVLIGSSSERREVYMVRLGPNGETLQITDAPFFNQPAMIAAPALPVGRLLIQGIDGGQDMVIESVNRSLLVAVITAGIAMLLLTIFLTRRMVSPLEALTSAARQMEKGDLSQRVSVQSQDEIGTLAHAFNAMADGLTRIETLRRNMVNDVAHELRTPLSNIRGYLEALQDGIARPTPEIIASLHEEAMLLTRLVDDLQELALAEAGQLRLARQPVAVAELVGQAVIALQPIAESKNLAVTIDVPPHLPDVYADAERVGQVLRNLLNNAIAHTQPMGRISVQARVVNTDTDGPHIEVRVLDTGSGISAEHLPYVFERFYRADASRARSTGGAGLGLAIVRQLVEAHQGRVRAESTEGKGSMFAFTLPLAVSP